MCSTRLPNLILQPRFTDVAKIVGGARMCFSPHNSIPITAGMGTRQINYARVDPIGHYTLH